jgi:hypothetical protein
MHSRGINIWLVGHSGMDRLCWEVWLSSIHLLPPLGEKTLLLGRPLNKIDSHLFWSLQPQPHLPGGKGFDIELVDSHHGRQTHLLESSEDRSSLLTDPLLASHRVGSLVPDLTRYSPPASEMNIQSVESSCPIRKQPAASMRCSKPMVLASRATVGRWGRDEPSHCSPRKGIIHHRSGVLLQLNNHQGPPSKASIPPQTHLRTQGHQPCLDNLQGWLIMN